MRNSIKNFFTYDYQILKNALNSLDQGVIIVKDSLILFANKSFTNLIGYSENEILNKPRDFFISEFNHPMMAKMCEYLLLDKSESKPHIIEILNKNGETIQTEIKLEKFIFHNEIYRVIFFRDVREQLLEENQRHLREIQFTEIFKNTAVSICLCDTDGNIIISNQSFENLFRFSQVQLKNLNLKFLFNDENITKYFKELNHFSKVKDNANYQLQVNYNQISKWLSVYLNVIRYKDYVIGVLFSIIDISKQVELETKNEFKKLLLQNLMNYFPESIYFKDKDGKYIRVNTSTLAKFTFKSFDEIIGKTDFELFSPEYATQTYNDELKLLHNKSNFIKTIEKETFKDGKTKWVLTTKIPLKDSNDNTIGTVGISQDISEIRKKELILEALFKVSSSITKVNNLQQLFFEIHQIIKTLMKADNFFIALIDKDNNTISFPYFVDLYDSPPQPRKLKKGLTEYVIRKKKPMLIDEEQDLELRLKGETELIGEPSKIWLGVPLIIDDRVIGAIVVQDYENKNTYGVEEKEILNYVSEQIALAINKISDEQKLKVFSNELKELVATKDKLFSIISHDLKSPMQGLLGMIDIVLEDLDILSKEELLEILNDTKSSLNGLYKMIENLLNWSRFQTGRLQLQPRNLNAFILVDNAINNLIHTAKVKRINILNNINSNFFILGDENLLHSLFHNLISNSIKFTPVKGQIVINSLDIGDKILFEIIDNGLGISPGNIEKLLQSNSFLTTLGTNNEKGTGLGIALCKEIINVHKGKLEISSELGKGTKISFDLIKAI